IFVLGAACARADLVSARTAPPGSGAEYHRGGLVSHRLFRYHETIPARVYSLELSMVRRYHGARRQQCAADRSLAAPGKVVRRRFLALSLADERHIRVFAPALPHDHSCAAYCRRDFAGECEPALQP